MTRLISKNDDITKGNLPRCNMILYSPYSVTLLKEICIKEIGLCAENMVTILDSILSIMERCGVKMFI